MDLKNELYLYPTPIALRLSISDKVSLIKESKHISLNCTDLNCYQASAWIPIGCKMKKRAQICLYASQTGVFICLMRCSAALALAPLSTRWSIISPSRVNKSRQSTRLNMKSLSCRLTRMRLGLWLKHWRISQLCSNDFNRLRVSDVLSFDVALFRIE